MLSEELGLQKLLEGREGLPCSGSARQFELQMRIVWIAVLAQTAVPNDAH